MNHTCRVDRALVAVLALVFLGAAPAKHEELDDLATQGQLPTGPMSYLVTPVGHRFRFLGTVPLTDASGKKLAVLASYEGHTRDPAAAATAAAELMDAMGPELQAAGETDLVVQARVGFDPRKFVNRTTAFHVTFKL
jgi:hypothetical protein